MAQDGQWKIELKPELIGQREFSRCAEKIRTTASRQEKLLANQRKMRNSQYMPTRQPFDRRAFEREAQGSQQRYNQQMRYADLLRRRAALYGSGSMFAALPDFNPASSEADFAKADEAMKRMESMAGQKKVPYSARASRQREMTGDEAVMRGRRSDLLTKAKESMSNTSGNGLFDDAVKQFRQQQIDLIGKAESNLDASLKGRPNQAEAQMEGLYGDSTRREGGAWKTDVPTQSGIRSIDVAPSGTQQLRSAVPGYDKMTPQQRAAAIGGISKGTTGAPIGGTRFTDFRPGAGDQDPNGMRYINELQSINRDRFDRRYAEQGNPKGNYRDVGFSVGQAAQDKEEAMARVRRNPFANNVPRDATSAIAVVDGAGNERIGYATNRKPTGAQPQVGNYMAANSIMPGGGAANTMWAGALNAAKATGPGTNIQGPAGQKGEANKVAEAATQGIFHPKETKALNPAQQNPFSGFGDLRVSNASVSSVQPNRGMGDMRVSNDEPNSFLGRARTKKVFHY